MTKEEAWLLWMKESKHYVEYDWDAIKKSSHWEAFSRGWDAASVNANGWDDAYKMGMEAGKEISKGDWGLSMEEAWELYCDAKAMPTDGWWWYEQMIEETLYRKLYGKVEAE